MKIGLVLEGGGMRGVFTAGVLDVFLEEGISFDSCYGVSAGACLACSFLCGQKGRGYSVMTDYLDNRDYCSWSSFLRTGDLFGADFLYHKIPEQLYPIDNVAFLRNPTEFYSVATDCRTGEAEYFRVKDMFLDVDAVRASASLPLVSRMVPVGDGLYLDGGVADPIPMQKAFEDGCDLVIAVLTRPRGYRKGAESTASLMRWKYRKYPEFVRSLNERPRVYNETVDRLFRAEEEGRVFVIAPEEALPIRRTEKDLSILRKGYEDGAGLARFLLPGLKDFIRK